MSTPQLYVCILDNGQSDVTVKYYSTLERGLQWVARTLQERGCRTIEHISHIGGYVTTQGGYHSPSVRNPDTTPMGAVSPPYVTVTPIYK